MPIKHLPSLASVWLALWFRFQSNTCPLWQVHRVTLKVFRYLLSHGWAVPTCTVSNSAHRKGNFPPSQSRTNRYKIWRLWCSAWRYSCYSYGISLCVTATTRELFSYYGENGNNLFSQMLRWNISRQWCFVLSDWLKHFF